MNNPLISIILPVFNSSKTLEKCLCSIAEQTYSQVEVLIMDGISTDKSIEIASRFKEKYSNFILFSDEDAGIYDAMNKGIAAARGEWIYFMGGDDRLFDANVLAKVAAQIGESDDLLYGDCEWLPEKVWEKGSCRYTTLLNRSINHQRIFYKRCLFATIPAFNLEYKVAADYELNIRLFCNPDVTKRYIPVPIAYYHSGGFSANKIDEAFWGNWEQIFVKNFKHYLPDKEIYNRVAWYCWHQIRQKKYAAAFKSFATIFGHTRNFRFVQHTASQTMKSLFA